MSGKITVEILTDSADVRRHDCDVVFCRYHHEVKRPGLFRCSGNDTYCLLEHALEWNADVCQILEAAIGALGFGTVRDDFVYCCNTDLLDSLPNHILGMDSKSPFRRNISNVVFRMSISEMHRDLPSMGLYSASGHEYSPDILAGLIGRCRSADDLLTVFRRGGFFDDMVAEFLQFYTCRIPGAGDAQ